MVLPERIELSTSPLPRECSTTELRQRPVRGPFLARMPANTRGPPRWQGRRVDRLSADPICRAPLRWKPDLPSQRIALAATDFRCISRLTATRKSAIPNHQLLERLPALSLHRGMSEPPHITPKKSVERAAREARLAKALRENLVRRKGQKRAQDGQAVTQSEETDLEREPPA
jgi:hypothetical protein